MISDLAHVLRRLRRRLANAFIAEWNYWRVLRMVRDISIAQRLVDRHWSNVEVTSVEFGWKGMFMFSYKLRGHDREWCVNFSTGELIEDPIKGIVSVLKDRAEYSPYHRDMVAA